MPDSEQIDQRLRDSPELLAGIIGSAMDAIIAVDAAQKIVLFNAAAERVFACPANEAIGSSVERFIPERFRAGHSTRVRRFGESGVSNRSLRGLGTLWGLRATGEEFPIEASISKVESGGQKYFTVVIRDITERKMAEEALCASEERLRLAQQAARIGTFEWNIGTGVNTWTPELEAIYGLPLGGFGGTQTVFENLVHPDDRAGVIELVKGAFKTGQPTKGEWRTVWPDGSVHWIAGRWQVYMNESGQPSRMVGVNIDITDRKLAEDRLREYEKAVEGVEEMIVVVDREYRYLIANRKFLNLRNMTREQVEGRFAHEVLNKDFFEAVVKPKLDECFQGKVVRYETKYSYPEIGERDILISYFPIEAANGIDRAACIMHDITDRKRSEESLRESEQRFRLAAQAGKMYSFEWDVTTDRVMRSSEHVEVLGVKEPLHITHQQFMDKVHPDDRPKLIAAIAGLSPENPTCNVSYRVLVSDGAAVWIKSSGHAFFDGEGRMLRLVGMAADVTDQKRAEEALRISEERLRLAQWAARIGTFEWNIRTGLSTRTPELEALYGVPPGSFGGTHEAFENLVHPDDRAGVIKLVDWSLETGQPTEGEWRVVWGDGSVHWIAGRWQALMDESGEPSRIVGVNLDVTERKQAEEILRESEERFRLVANTAPVMIWMSGVDKKPTYFNQLWLDFTGISESKLKDGLVGIVHPEDYPQCQDTYCHGFDQRQPFRKECRLLRHDGQYRWMLDIGVPRFHKDGSFAGYIGSCIDVTDRKLAEEALAGMSRKLIEAQEQERARIARELHDDVAQRLAFLAIELEQLKDNPSEVRSRVQELRKQTTEISNDVQALSHDLHSSQLEYLGVVAGMKSWCKEFGERQGMQIDYRHDARSTVPTEIGLSLFRVLQEALHNAAKHSGVKRIEVQLHEESGEIHLIVSDLGRGFDIEAASQGKGLGLTSMRERVRLANGTIAIESKPMGGTTIHVRVPFKSENGSQQAAG